MLDQLTVESASVVTAHQPSRREEFRNSNGLASCHERPKRQSKPPRLAWPGVGNPLAKNVTSRPEEVFELLASQHHQHMGASDHETRMHPSIQGRAPALQRSAHLHKTQAGRRPV